MMCHQEYNMKVQSVRQPVSSSCHLKAADRGRIWILCPMKHPQVLPSRVADTSPRYQLTQGNTSGVLSDHTETQAGLPGSSCHAEVSAPADPDMFLNQSDVSIITIGQSEAVSLPDPRHDPVHREPGPGARPAAAVVA